MSEAHRFTAVICGAGVAGLEAALRLRHLAGDRISLTLVNPSDSFVYRPNAARQPFSLVRPRAYELDRVVKDLDLTWIRDEVGFVDRDAGILHTAGGAQIGYDALLVAVGARRLAPPAGAVSFSDRTAEALTPLFRKVFVGETHSVLFAEPDGPCWPIPIYELALQTAQVAAGNGHRAEVHLSVPGGRPLDAFGVEAGMAMADLLTRSGVTLHTNVSIGTVGTDRVLFEPVGAVNAELVVTVPRLTGPNVRGLPGEANERFLSVDAQSHVVDSYGAVVGGGRVFAAGDCTHLPIKHGGVGAQQADTAAAQIAHLAGFGDPARPLHPVVEGVLHTGNEVVHLRAQLIAGRGWHATVDSRPPDRSTEKIFAAELGPYLARFDA